MACTTRHLWWVGAVVATASALCAPAGVAAAGQPSPTTGARGTTVTDVRPEPAGATDGGGGLDRRDAAVVAAILAGVVLMGFRGYVVVGAMIAGIAAVIAAGAQLVTGAPKHRARKDWPSPVAARYARDAKPEDERPGPLGQPKAEIQ